MSAPGEVQRRDGRTTDTRARSQAIALELFIRDGFAGTTLQGIADRLGLTKAALYYHFPSKGDLVRSVIQPMIDDVDRFLDEAERAPMPTREFLERYFDLVRLHRHVFMALIRDPTGLAIVDAEGWVARWTDRTQRLLAGPDATNARRIRAMAAVSGLSRCAILLIDIPDDELRAVSVDVASQTLDGDHTTTSS